MTPEEEREARREMLFRSRVLVDDWEQLKKLCPAAEKYCREILLRSRALVDDWEELKKLGPAAEKYC